MQESSKLKKTFILTLITLLCVFLAVASATVAWYIFTVNAHTTNLRMAAGTNIALQISNAEDGEFKSSVELEKFQGLLNPVSTNSIAGGFQKVTEFAAFGGSKSLLAYQFTKSLELDKDFYKTSLFFRTNGEKLDVYVGNIGYKDDDEENPISTAARIGFVRPDTGEEFIFSINEGKNPSGRYNTYTGQEGYVLDCTKEDGTTVPFTHLTQDNWCNYDASTGSITLKEGSVPLCSVEGDGENFGQPVRLDVYIWLEGCDEDCTGNLSYCTLQELALSFAGYAAQD